MKKIISTSTFAVGAIALMAVAAAVWITYTKEIKAEFKQLDKPINGISAIGVQYDQDKIFLNVHTTKDLNCAEIFQVLDIGPIIVKDKVYLSECNLINGRLIEIVFTTKESM